MHIESPYFVTLKQDPVNVPCYLGWVLRLRLLEGKKSDNEHNAQKNRAMGTHELYSFGEFDPIYGHF